MKKLGVKVDVVWSFDFNLFPNLRDFGARVSIFHPVDPLSTLKQTDIGRQSDLIISVSKKILKNFDAECFKHKKLLINHGLSQEFSSLLNSPDKYSINKSLPINVGYFGNLDRSNINIKVWSELIMNHAEVSFHFWGPYEVGLNFYNSMVRFHNVTLHGRKNKAELIKEIIDIDCFMLIYSENTQDSDLSNSHKILEYLSTGKVIVSSKIEAYIDHDDLIRMPSDGDDNKIPLLFNDTLNNLKRLNSQELMIARKKIPRLFTYEENLKKIDEWFVLNGFL